MTMPEMARLLMITRDQVYNILNQKRNKGLFEFVYIADRENARVQVLTLEGEPVRDLRANPGGHPYAAKPIGSGYVLTIEGRDMAGRQGAIGRIHGPNGQLERVFDAGVDPRTGNSRGHDVAVARDGSVYMVGYAAGRVVKFELASAGVASAD